MPFTDSQDVQIHYEVEGEGAPLVLHHVRRLLRQRQRLHVEGEGAPLVLHHGLTGDIIGWYESGLVEALKQDFQLILIDARGHGESEKLVAPEAYSLRLMAQDVVAVLDELGIEKTYYLGYSLGGFVGLALVKHFDSRVRALMIGGADPAGPTGPARSELEGLRERLKVGAEHGVDAYLTRLRELYGYVDPQFEAQMLRKDRTDMRAYLAVVTEALERPIDFTSDLKSLTLPTLIYLGAMDELYPDIIKVGAETYPNASFVLLSDQNHLGAFYRGDLVEPIVREFLASIS